MPETAYLTGSSGNARSLRLVVRRAVIPTRRRQASGRNCGTTGSSPDLERSPPLRSRRRLDTQTVPLIRA